MRRDATLFGMLRDATQQAIRNLENLRMRRSDEDAAINELMRDLRSVIPSQDSEWETQNAD